MIQPVCRDVFLLSRKSQPAEKADLPVAVDLMDTLRHHSAECVGMAANMIGQLKRIIAVSMGMSVLVMINPVIVSKSEPHEAEEGCLSLAGVRKTTRYNSITVVYQDMQLRQQKATYTGWTAQIIQHEVDHLDGILI